MNKPPGAAGAALGAQQLCQLKEQFTGDIEHGTIGDQRGVLGRVGSRGKELPIAGPTSQPASAGHRRVGPLILPILLRSPQYARRLPPVRGPCAHGLPEESWL